MLVTDSYCAENLDFKYTNDFPEATVNWSISPWNFPVELDHINDYDYGGKNLKLWSRMQIQNALSLVNLEKIETKISKSNE